MKRILITMALVGCVTNTAYAKEIVRPCIITEVNTETDTVLIENPDGNIYEFEGVEDWEVNDIVRVEFDSKGTVNPVDDEIISMEYIGYLL